MDSQGTVFEAIEFATRAHAGQYRKGTRVPYILHPLRVGTLLIEVDSPEDVVVAGILHDTVEDTPVTLTQVAERFGAGVASLVDSVSEPDRRASWEQRKQHTIDRLRAAETETLLIACADKLDNLRSMRRGEIEVGSRFWDRFHRPRDQQAWYYCEVCAAIADAAETGPLARLWRDLDHEVRTMFR